MWHLLLIAQDVLSEHFVKRHSEGMTQKFYSHTCYVLAAMVRKLCLLMVVIKA